MDAVTAAFDAFPREGFLPERDWRRVIELMDLSFG